MHYQVSRNGQTYGPYTLEDLQRYLTSGNVLTTDLVKSDEMPDWIPVSELLASHAVPGSSAPGSASETPATPAFTTPGYANPTYTAPDNPLTYNPAGNPALAASPYPDAPNLHWGLYLLFTLITCCLFSKVFTVVQAAWLKRVQPNSNAIVFYAGLYGLWLISLIFGIGNSVSIVVHHGILHHTNPGRGILTLVYFILLFVTRFIMSASLEEHFNGPEPIGLRLNPVMTFFLGGIYFQYHLNRINQIKQAARYGAVRAF